tara:strand:+ start:1004 stop:1156 length:153 start_codon:yes stop_codon:yes gene_type:complete
MGKIILKYNPKTGKVEEHSESTHKEQNGLLIKKSRPGLKWTHKHGHKLKK